jgi:hypothetical protein
MYVISFIRSKFMVFLGPGLFENEALYVPYIW